MAQEIPNDLDQAIEVEEATSLTAIDAEQAALEEPPAAPDLTPVMDMVQSVTG